MDKHRLVITGLVVVAPERINIGKLLGQPEDRLEHIDQRRTFTTLITTVKQTSLRYRQRVETAETDK